MDLMIEIPKEFVADFNADRFADFFERQLIANRVCNICGNYERETLVMLKNAFRNAVVMGHSGPQ